MSVSCQDCKIKRCHYCLIEGAFIIKVILLGDGCVGKTQLVRRFCYDSFEPYTYPTTAKVLPFDKRTIRTEGKTVKFYVHELSGMYIRFRIPLPAIEIREMAGAMLVYDVTKRSTFEHVEYWRKQLRDNAAYHSAPILLVGTKCDLQNQIEVTTEEACIYAEVHCSKDIADCSLFGTSRDIVNIGKDKSITTRCCGII
ncbi:uncharacterized protein LOC123542319 isoform X2 [Mercenaria mercenaria]|uniref:uncharacterized protein LOC123542319 isoform X2 n=1 Tax=Mercenaria mercenaria TaxID=6596 RepID=UPI00234EC5BD|nr:uncharacterized protein LOC123542319 isoform X2 [Mercenaria mercenaria]